MTVETETVQPDLADDDEDRPDFRALRRALSPTAINHFRGRRREKTAMEKFGEALGGLEGDHEALTEHFEDAVRGFDPDQPGRTIRELAGSIDGSREMLAERKRRIDAINVEYEGLLKNFEEQDVRAQMLEQLADLAEREDD
jgi:hypothetical protein